MINKNLKWNNFLMFLIGLETLQEDKKKGKGLN